MTAGAVLILATAICTLLTAIIGLLVSMRNIQRMDGRLTELLELTRKSSHAQGVKDEKENPS